MHRDLAALRTPVPFASRHIGPAEDDIAKMLAVVGYGSLDELTGTAVPEAIKALEGLNLPAGRSEPEVLAELRELADQQLGPMASMIGTGLLRHRDPAGDPAATCWRVLPGTPPTRPTSPRSAKAGSRRCSTSRPSSPT